MGRAAVAITLSEAERRELEGLARRRKTAQGLARRARIVLAAAEGLENKAIVERLGADANTVGKWRRRFAERRLDGLYDEPRSGAPRKIGDERIAEIIGRTLEETPPDGTHWSLRSMARAVGYAPSTIHRIWQVSTAAGICTGAAAQKCTTGSVVACPRSPWEGPARGATRPPRGWRRPARGWGLWAHAGKRGVIRTVAGVVTGSA